MKNLVLVDEPRAGICRLTLNRAERRNAFVEELREAVIDQLTNALTAGSVRAIVIRGAGKDFCAGGDLQRLSTLRVTDIGPLLERGHCLIRLLVNSSKPVVAAVQGSAAGGGAGVALACDAVVMAQSARFVTPFFRIGLAPDYGLAWTMTRRMGSGAARRLLLDPKPVSALEAKTCGLADHVVADDELDECSLNVAQRLAEHPPIAYAATKKLLDAALPPLQVVLSLEAREQPVCFGSPAFSAGVASFLNRASTPRSDT